jgi:hypothetical protein
MDQGNSSLRDRLLARLPQPENLTAFREETAALLAKHKRALFWDRWTTLVISFCGMGLFLLTFSTWGQKLYSTTIVTFDVMAGILFFLAQLYNLGYNFNRNHVNLLKEVKQVQLQVLELQASLRKAGNE